jgi:hypothetical protein
MGDFRDDAQLDPWQVEDMRGSSGRSGCRFPEDWQQAAASACCWRSAAH